MCWVYPSSQVCYECNTEWNYKVVTIPCRYQELAGPTDEQCTRRTPLAHVFIDYDNCEACKSARQAEEIVQQRIHRLIPLYYDITKKGASRQSYWDAVRVRKEESSSATGQASSASPSRRPFPRRTARALRNTSGY